MKNQRQQASIVIWQALPAFTMLLAFVLMLMLAGAGRSLTMIIPPLPLLVAFFWLWEAGRHRDLCVLALLGVVTDITFGLPLGFSASAWLLSALTCWYCLKLADDDESFLMRWTVIGIALGVLALAQYIIGTLFGMNGVSVALLLLQWAVSLLVYPTVHVILLVLRHRVYRKVWIYLPAELRPGAQRA